MNLNQIKVEYVISFSDAVFAFSVTFMALSIQLPNFPSGIEESELTRRLKICNFSELVEQATKLYRR